MYVLIIILCYNGFKYNDMRDDLNTIFISRTPLSPSPIWQNACGLASFPPCSSILFKALLYFISCNTFSRQPLVNE